MIIKANHTLITSKTKPQLASSSRYYRTREGESRDGFNRDQDRIEQREVNRAINQTEHQHSYRLIINPGGGHTESDLKELTRDTMGSLERPSSEFDWVAYEHRHHSAHDHVHVLALSEDKINHQELTHMRDIAIESWRQHSREQALTQSPSQQEGRTWSRS